MNYIYKSFLQFACGVKSRRNCQKSTDYMSKIVDANSNIVPSPSGEFQLLVVVVVIFFCHKRHHSTTLSDVTNRHIVLFKLIRHTNRYTNKYLGW